MKFPKLVSPAPRRTRTHFVPVYFLLVCNWPYSFGQNHLFRVKMLYNRDSTIQKCFRRFCTACKSEDFQFPVSRPDDRAIPSGRSSVYCSIRPDEVPYRLDARHIKHHSALLFLLTL
jgi:hypothetical protein